MTPSPPSQRQSDEACELLRESSLFAESSDELLQRLAKCMTPVQAKAGHVFMHEGQEVADILVLEQGKLIRTKKYNDGKHENQRQDNGTNEGDGDALEEAMKDSIVVDTLEKRGRVSGVLHSIRPGGTAFATVIAAASDETDDGSVVKVWTMKSQDFRDVLMESPEYAMDVMAAIARELRTGSKSLRGLMEAVRSKEREGENDDSKDKTRTCKVLCYDATTWTRLGFEPGIKHFNEANKDTLHIDMDFTDERLSEKTAAFAAGYDAVCLFVNDNASADVLKTLSLMGIKMVAMRCAGIDRVDTKAAKAYGMTVARVPAYSPYAVAEMAIALLMSVNRKIHRASNRVKMANFTLDAGLMGMDIHGKTVGVMGTGKIGQIMCDIMLGFGVNLLCYDVYENQDIKDKGGVYVSKEEIFAKSDILMLAMPLIKPTYHTINGETLSMLKPGVIIINTSRGGLVDTKALLSGLRSGVIGGVGMDVYENEQEYFFQDWSAKHMEDEDLMALLGNNNVVLTAHQAFFTKEAVDQIVKTTLSNLYDYSTGKTGQEHPNNCIPKEQ